MAGPFKNIHIYLASQSSGRQELLTNLGIPFSVISHTADESTVTRESTVEKYVCDLALLKAEKSTSTECIHAPEKKQYLLTADTVIVTEGTDEILEKPKNHDDAIRMLKIMQTQPITLITGHCLVPVISDSSGVTTIDYDNKTLFLSETSARFIVPDHLIEYYLESVPGALYACGAAVVEGIGNGFLAWIDGSYSGAIGIDVHQLLTHISQVSHE